MKNVAIYGAGGFGREVALLIETINKVTPQYNFIGFFDDNKKPGTEISLFGRVLGGVEQINKWPQPLCVAIAIGAPATAMKVRNTIENENITFPNLIHPNFLVDDPQTFHMGEGNIIQRSCRVTTNVKMGDFNILNGDVILGHDVTLGNNNSLMTGTRISGEVSIGNRNLFGVYSIVIQRLKIGDDITLAAGSALLTNPRNGHTYIGVPAKHFKF